jgi:hypothetical protein
VTPAKKNSGCCCRSSGADSCKSSCWIYAVSIVVAFWFNSFVAVVQAFRKIPFLNGFAPTQSEPPFAVVQIVVLLIIVWLIYASVKRFHPGTAAAAH